MLQFLLGNLHKKNPGNLHFFSRKLCVYKVTFGTKNSRKSFKLALGKCVAGEGKQEFENELKLGNLKICAYYGKNDRSLPNPPGQT